MDDLAARDEPNLYETDLYTWTQQQAALLRSGCLASLDIVNVIEEIESLGRAQIHALRSRYAVLCLHLLKLIVQPGREGRSWHLTIVEQRIQIRRLLDGSPGLKPKRKQLFEEGYQDGRKLCIAQIGLSEAEVPFAPSFTVDHAENEAWLPKASAP